MKTDLFQQTSEDKKIIEKVSAFCGIKQEVIRLVLESLFITNYIEILEKKDDKIKKLLIPFIGTVIVRQPVKDENGMEVEQDPWFLLSDNIRNSIKNIQENKHNSIIEWIQKNYIDTIIDQIEETT